MKWALPTPKRIVRVVKYILPGIALLCVVSIWNSPFWWDPADSDDADALERASVFEQQISSRVHRIRTEPEPWGFKVDETMVNEWLATRLPRWIEHDEDLQWPPGIHQVQIHFAPGIVEVAGQGTAGLVWHARFGIEMQDGQLSFTPISAGVGSMPIFGAGFDGLLNVVPEGVVNEEGVITVPGEIPLVDGRTLRLEDIEASSGGLAVLFLTELRGEVGQK